MLRRRIIPCLDVSGGRVVKGIEFVNLRDCGDPVEAAVRYAEQGADEIVWLNITPRPRLAALLAQVERAAERVDVPVTSAAASGSSTSRELLLAGADKVVDQLGRAARPELLVERAADALRHASAWSCAIDARRTDGSWRVHLDGGRTPDRARRDRLGRARPSSAARASCW